MNAWSKVILRQNIVKKKKTKRLTKSTENTESTEDVWRLLWKGLAWKVQHKNY